jgi:hypothetical protein
MQLNHRLRALAFVVLAALIAVGAALATTSRSTVKPSNNTVPSISGTAAVGSTLTADPGTWSGSQPISYQYQWQVCGQNGNNCHAISGATSNTYVIKSGDAGNTLRVHVIAGNSDGSAAATSAPTQTVSSTPVTTATTTTSTVATQPAANGCPKTTASSQAVAVADVASPARLQITGFTPSMIPITRSVGSLNVRFHVSDTCGQAVSGANVYATAVPYGQFSIPSTATTDANGNVTLTFRRMSGFPAKGNQQLLVMFVRASQPGQSILSGITTSRLVSLKVNLHG